MPEVEMIRKEFKPHGYQRYCIEKIIENPCLGVFLDPGMGKTAITLAAINELKLYRWDICKCLIVAPKKVAEATWQTEAAQWVNLAENLRFSTVLGTAAQRVAALKADADVYVINRENIPWLVDQLKNKWCFDMVVLDESTSFKNPHAKRFRALKAVLPHIRRLVALTGTPSPHGVMDLWAQIYLLDGGKRLGRTLTAYRDIYFVPDKRSYNMIYSYKPKDGAIDAIQEAISDICISMRAEDYIDLPDLMYHDIPIKLDPAAAKAYKRLERDALLSIGDDTVITAASAAVLTGKLLQLCNGAVYDENGTVQEIHDCKLQALEELIESLQGQHALIFYNYRHDLPRIIGVLQKSGITDCAVYRGSEQADIWNSGKLQILLAQPQSCGYGLNLQKGGHHVIWFGLTWSLEQYIQANRRLYRQGQKYPVVVHNLIVQGGVDEDVMRALNSNEQVQDKLLTALRARVQVVKGTQ